MAICRSTSRPNLIAPPAAQVPMFRPSGSVVEKKIRDPRLPAASLNCRIDPHRHGHRDSFPTFGCTFVPALRAVAISASMRGSASNNAGERMIDTHRCGAQTHLHDAR